jgi:hypothetical protein
MSRILGIELRRSAALGSALVLLVVGCVLLFFVGGPVFVTGWLQLAMTQREYPAILWPLALAAGAWQARREHRSNVAELFASTARPRTHPMVPTLGAMTIAVVGGYLAMGIAGGLWIIGTARYLPVSVFAVTAVGGLALIAAVWLGLAIGRLLPSARTAPALAVAGLGLLLMLPAATRPWGWLALVFSPISEMNMPHPYQAVPNRASVAQAVWLAALAVTAVTLLASSGWRTRVAALLPAVLGAALAITVMPHQERVVVNAVDPVARELVCAKDEPRVCVSRVHSGLLPEVVVPAREALTLLAKLPNAPTQVHEDTTTFFPDFFPPWHEDVVLFDLKVGQNGHLDKTGMQAAIVSDAFQSPAKCMKSHVTGWDKGLAAAYWLIGREPVASGPKDPTMALGYDSTDIAKAVQLWQMLRGLPDNEAKARVAALRQASGNCSAGEQLSSPSTP